MKESIFILILSTFLFGINEFSYAQWTTIGSNIYYNSGSVGIGTANPVQKLHVSGNIQSSSNKIKSSSPNIWFEEDDQILNEKKWLIAAYNGSLQFQPRNDDFGYTGNSMSLRRDLSVFFGNDIDVTGNIVTNGRNIYFGEAQKLFGDNLSALYYSSNSSTAAQLIMRDKEGKLYGRLYGDNDGVNFGLLDGDGNWSYLAVKDSYTGFRINNSEKMRIMNNGYVGIGTTTPSQKLHVSGNIQSSSNKIKSSSPNIWFEEDDQILNEKKWLIAAYNGSLQFQPRNDDFGYTGNSMSLRRDLSVYFGNDIDVTGNIVTNGRNIYFGEAQKLFGDNLSALYYSSNSSTATQLIMRDKEGKLYGRLYGDNNGVNFGLLDGDGNWSYLASKDNFTAFRINNLEKMRIQSNGNIGIGTANPQSKLAVNGTITSIVAITTQTGWSDFVFKKDYKLSTLQEVEAFIKENGHLPDVPTEEYIKINGNNLGETDAILLQKIEELTLYMIEANEQRIEMNNKILDLQTENQGLKYKIENLQK